MINNGRFMDRVWNKIMRSGKPIKRNKDTSPFKVYVTANGSEVNILVKPEPVASVPEALPMISNAVMTAIEKFKYQWNDGTNRDKLTEELTGVLKNLWDSGLIEPKPEEKESKAP